MAKPKEVFDISTAAKEDSYNISAESVSSNLMTNILNKMSKIEKTFYLVVIFTAVIIAIGTVFVRTKVMQSEQNLTNIQYEIEQKKTRHEELDQQIQELSRSERVTKIAEKNNLRSNNKNIRKATK
ncbi:cell division protein FtsL [Floricoccus tropicus]|uniref:Cell division protein FtsL n=1 Tax=Floricoccus tropicus TaxID=1859473 RepID=A0A1E8GMB5_9LACT|nr:cell division protein FtsL [Floricoccus tropicus]OFI49391.1 cell division protein FtsL [Floricoccus tropicus]